MKKAIFAILAVLTVFAMTMVSCGGGGDTPLPLPIVTYFTVTYDLNGAEGTPPDPAVIPAGGFVVLPTEDDLADDVEPPEGTPYLAGWSLADDGDAIDGLIYTPAADVTLYAVWSDTPPVPPPDLYPTKTWVEKVELENGNVAAYYFELPTGKTFADYDGIKADYLVDEATFEAENRVRGGPRLYGNYPVNYLKLVEVTEAGAATPKFFAASIGNGSGEWGNGNLILDDGMLGGSWGSITEQLTDKMAEAGLTDIPVANDWWTLSYWTDATKANGSYNRLEGEGTATAGLYNPSGAGPFIFGLGLTGAGTPTVALVADVRLVGKEGTDDLIGKPLYIKASDGSGTYPAFVSYTSTSGNGVKFNKRTFVKGAIDAVDQAAPAAPASYTVTFNLNPRDSDTTQAFEDAFTGTKSVQSGYWIGDLPTATSDNWRFKGWATTAAGTTAITSSKKFYENATLYAIWGINLPDATVDLVITPKIDSFGGLGAINHDAGYGPHSFDPEYSYDAMLWFGLTDAVESHIYKSVEIKFTAVKVSGEGPRKLVFHLGRASETYSGGTPKYEDINEDTVQTKTYDIDDLTIDKGILIAHNQRTQSCKFNFTITEIKLLKP